VSIKMAAKLDYARVAVELGYPEQARFTRDFHRIPPVELRQPLIRRAEMNPLHEEAAG
jgi:hypothetical protein